jgi:hypothetical protein
MKWGIVQSGSEDDPCCCETCCMYPRIGIPDSYSFDDLPDKLNVDFPEGAGEWTLDRSQGVYCPSGSYVLGELGYGYAEVGDWVLWYPDPLGETHTSRPISPCLITGDGNLTPGDDSVEDQFEPTYTVTFDVDFDPPTISETIDVHRVSLCVWESTEIDPPIFPGGPTGPVCTLRYCPSGAECGDLSGPATPYWWVSGRGTEWGYAYSAKTVGIGQPDGGAYDDLNENGATVTVSV